MHSYLQNTFQSVKYLIRNSKLVHMNCPVLHASQESGTEYCLCFQGMCPLCSGIFPLLRVLCSPCHLSVITIVLQPIFTDLTSISCFFFFPWTSFPADQLGTLKMLFSTSKFKRLIFRILLLFITVPVTLVILLIWVVLLMCCLLVVQIIKLCQT